ncbi:RNA 2',3'-cyclic phosphodiesterase [Desulfonatronum thioautotrophicum]|uniref:RNA 2',3'-cyclic phosphodiesterase n=1 Tax=Desulfonatronum thioautotrophicum TaxID=617001 RepID=UPI0005EB2D30|nr:RNA 2',3'-cyclic phosphodiesterase [Desulfonatronum thioautotrophicum]
MRCFIGLPLPESYQRLLAQFIRIWQPKLTAASTGGVSWTRPENWHLTLKFLGELSQDQAKRLGDGLLQAMSIPAVGESFVVQGRGGGFFPDLRRPRILWVGLGKGARKVGHLAFRVENSCAEMGFSRDHRPFLAHLTVARIKRQAKSRGTPYSHAQDTRHQSTWTEVLHALDSISWPEIVIDRMVLWESRLTPEGPTYRQLREWGLTAR